MLPKNWNIPNLTELKIYKVIIVAFSVYAGNELIERRATKCKHNFT